MEGRKAAVFRIVWHEMASMDIWGEFDRSKVGGYLMFARRVWVSIPTTQSSRDYGDQARTKGTDKGSVLDEAIFFPFLFLFWFHQLSITTFSFSL
jgi:hypothetical protein